VGELHHQHSELLFEARHDEIPTAWSKFLQYHFTYADMEEVGKNLPKLLTNPLNFMEKELEDNV
jgi:hypothetical protein